MGAVDREPVDSAVRHRWASRLLVTGGALSALMGAAHFALPVVYPWQQHVVGLYAPVRWALFATTVFFGVLLLLGGVLTALVARAAGASSRIVVWVVAGMAGFWLLAAGYEIAVPFPAPGADRALPAFSLVVAALHLAGLWLRIGPWTEGIARGDRVPEARLPSRPPDRP